MKTEWTTARSSRWSRISLTVNRAFRGLRITVYDLLDYLASGMREAEILTDFPDLRAEDLRTALAFAADPERQLPARV